MDQPKVTDEHLKKYDEIMSTPTPAAPAGDKKPAEDKKAEEKPVEEKNSEGKTAQVDPTQEPSTNPGVTDMASKGFVFTGKKIMSLDGKEKKEATIPGVKKHTSKLLLIIVAVVLLVAWTIFWAFFFGYIKL